MSGLSVRNLSVDYPARQAASGAFRALTDVTFDLQAGERLAVIGESGSGKSTLALAIAGLLPKGAVISGQIDWRAAGKPLLPGHDAGFVFQDPHGSFDPLTTIGKQLVEVRQTLTSDGRIAAREAAIQALAQVGLDKPEQIFVAYPHQLSGGQGQRAAIACALIGKPALLLADEPTSALDTIVQAGIIRLINGLVTSEGLSLIFVTHDLAVAHAMGDRIAVMRDSRMIALGGFAEVFAAPTDAYIRALRDSYFGPHLAQSRNSPR